MQALLGISCTKYRFVLHTVDTEENEGEGLEG